MDVLKLCPNPSFPPLWAGLYALIICLPIIQVTTSRAPKMPGVFKILPTTQKYDWGKIGLSSKVAQYAAACKLPGFTLDENAPYAEVSPPSFPLPIPFVHRAH